MNLGRVTNATGHRRPGEGSHLSGCGTNSRNLYFDLFGSGGFALRDMHLEDAILDLCVHLLGVSIVRQTKTTPKASVGALDPVVFSACILLLEFTLTGKNEYAVVDSNLDRVLFGLREISLN